MSADCPLKRPEYGRRPWTNPREVESHCANGARKLLDCLDDMFEGWQESIDLEQQIDGRIVRNPLDSHRLGADSSAVAAHIVEVQMEVLRRVLRRKQEDLAKLAAETSEHLTHAADLVAKKHLPRLPDEVILQIFRTLYFTQSKDAPGSQSTLWALKDDKLTPKHWVELIGNEIPLVVTEGNGSREPAVVSLVGSEPRIERPSWPNKFSNDTLPPPPSPATALMTVAIEHWEGGTRERISNLTKFPWSQLILVKGRYGPELHYAALKQTMNTILRDFRHELANLTHLLILPSDTCNLVPTFNVVGGRGVDLCQTRETPDSEVRNPRLRTVSLPIWLLRLPGLRPYLVCVTDLEAHLPQKAAERETIFHEFYDYLQPFSNTLLRLKLSDPINGTWLASRQEISLSTQLSLPVLESLSLSTFTESTLWDTLQFFDCPVLNDLSIISPSSDSDGILLSAAILHRRFPFLRSIDLTDYTHIEFFESLSVPDAEGNWLLPKLSCLRVIEKIERQNPFVFCATLVDMVRNRLVSDQTDSIRSLRLNCVGFDDDNMFVNALELLVPEASVEIFDGQHARDEQESEPDHYEYDFRSPYGSDSSYGFGSPYGTYSPDFIGSPNSSDTYRS